MKKIIPIIVILFILGGLNLGYDYYSFHDLNKNYNSIAYRSDTEEYLEYNYLLSISSMGNFNISDIGAGNPVMKVHLFKIPFTNKYIINCLFDSNFDPNFLNIKHKLKIISINTVMIGDKDGSTFIAIIFFNNNKQLQFNEIH